MGYMDFNFQEFYIRNYKLLKWGSMGDFVSLTVAVMQLARWNINYITNSNPIMGYDVINVDNV